MTDKDYIHRSIMDVDLSDTPYGSLLSSPAESLDDSDGAEVFSDEEEENFFDVDHVDVSDGRLLKTEQGGGIGKGVGKNGKINVSRRRATPWRSWAEWRAVYEGLVSTATDEDVGASVAVEKKRGALKIIAVWRQRGRLPVAVEAT